MMYLSVTRGNKAVQSLFKIKTNHQYSVFFLEGPGVAGYLTAGTTSSVMPNVPPPVDNEVGDVS